MKNFCMMTLIVIGLAIALILPINALKILIVPTQSDFVELDGSIEDNELEADTTNDSQENTETETITKEEIPLINNFEVEKVEEEKEIVSHPVNQEIKIVNGVSVKESFKYHNPRISTEELTFMVIDKRDNVTYYYDFSELDKDVLDETNYKKEFELNGNGELVKYIYTEWN